MKILVCEPIFNTDFFKLWPPLSVAPRPSGGRAWPPIIDCYGPWHWDLALAWVPPVLSASQDARNSYRISNTVAENEPRTLSLALSLALSRARSLSLSLTHNYLSLCFVWRACCSFRIARVRSSLSLSLSYTHTYKYTHTNTYTNTNTQQERETLSEAIRRVIRCRLSRAQCLCRACWRARYMQRDSTLSFARADIHTHTHTLSLSLSLSPSRTHTHTYAHLHTHTHKERESLERNNKHSDSVLSFARVIPLSPAFSRARALSLSLSSSLLLTHSSSNPWNKAINKVI